ncbi:hypothetical protein PSAC2689_130074 [Paraburkholderia sacchari]
MTHDMLPRKNCIKSRIPSAIQLFFLNNIFCLYPVTREKANNQRYV